MIKGNSIKYGKLAQLLHWVVAIYVFSISTIGILMWVRPSGFDPSTLINVHIVVGRMLAFLVVARVVWKWFDVTPGLPDRLSFINRIAYKTTHLSIYALLIAISISGITLALSLQSASLSLFTGESFRIDKTSLYLFHKLLVVILWCLIFGHVGGVLSYQFRKSDILSRMGVTWFLKE